MLSAWSAWYSGSAVVRTLVAFAHVGGLLIGGGSALASDAAILRAAPGDAECGATLARAHRVVAGGLAATVASGLLLLAADLETYLPSRTFWIKMTLVVALVVNGRRLARAGTRVTDGPYAWARLRTSARVSRVLWLAVTLLGVMLPNV